MGTAVVLAVLILAVVLAARSMIRDKKNGKSLQCGGDCSHCAGQCHRNDSAWKDSCWSDFYRKDSHRNNPKA